MFESSRFCVSLLALVLALAFQMSSSQAAEIVCLEQWGTAHPEPNTARRLWPSGYRPSPNSCKTALLRGTIQQGDYERFRLFYSQHYRALARLYLISPGGNVDDAAKIGRALRKHLTPTEAPSRMGDTFWLLAPNQASAEPLCQGAQCTCASACALIWFGAVDRTGAVGLHRPKIADPQFSTFPPGEASTLYRRVLLMLTRYLEEMETPRPLVDATVGTSSSDILWVDTEKNVELEHLPSFAEWIDARCGSFPPAERKMFEELNVRWGASTSQHFPGQVDRLGPHEEGQRKTLAEKHRTHLRCKLENLFARRDALPSL